MERRMLRDLCVSAIGLGCMAMSDIGQASGDRYADMGTVDR